MIFIIIESQNNKLVKHIKLLNTKKGRDIYNKFIVEGEKFINNINSNWCIECFVFSESYYKKNNIDYYLNRSKVYILQDKIFKTISDTVTPKGALALCKKNFYNLENILNKKFPIFLIADSLNDPGNLGTLIRTADTFNLDCVFISKNSVDVYNKKVLRSTAGSIFNIKVFENIDILNLLNKFKEKNIITIAGDLKGNDIIYNLKLNFGYAIIIGNESRGVSNDLLNIVNYKVKIPILGKSESLNASVASGILIYELLRKNIKNNIRGEYYEKSNCNYRNGK